MKLFLVDEGKQDVLSMDISLHVTKSTRITSGFRGGTDADDQLHGREKYTRIHKQKLSSLTRLPCNRQQNQIFWTNKHLDSEQVL